MLNSFLDKFIQNGLENIMTDKDCAKEGEIVSSFYIRAGKAVVLP